MLAGDCEHACQASAPGLFAADQRAEHGRIVGKKSGEWRERLHQVRSADAIGADTLPKVAGKPCRVRHLRRWRIRSGSARAQIEASIPMGRFGTPEEVAEAIVWLLSEKAAFITGAHVNVAGGGFAIG